MICLQILQRFLKNKGLLRIWGVLYIASILIVVIISLYFKLNLNLKGLHEKKVNFFYVYFENIKMSTHMYFIGIITCGLFAVILLLNNIFTVGVIANQMINSNKVSLAYKMLPHGIFEFAGMTLIAATSFWMFYISINMLPRVIKREAKINELLMRLAEIFIESYIINLLIFFIAAIIETMVSYMKFL